MTWLEERAGLLAEMREMGGDLGDLAVRIIVDQRSEIESLREEAKKLAQEYDAELSELSRDRNDALDAAESLGREMKAIDVALELLGDESVDARNEGEAAVCRGIAHALREIAKARGDLDEAPAHFRERECKACGATIADGPNGLEVV